MGSPSKAFLQLKNILLYENDGLFFSKNILAQNEFLP